MATARLVALCILLAGCGQTAGTFCEFGEPHTFTERTLSVMTAAEVKQELRHNKKGERLCGWKP